MARNRIRLPWVGRQAVAGHADASFFEGDEAPRRHGQGGAWAAWPSPAEEADGERRWNRSLLREKVRARASGADHLGVGISAAALLALEEIERSRQAESADSEAPGVEDAGGALPVWNGKEAWTKPARKAAEKGAEQPVNLSWDASGDDAVPVRGDGGGAAGGARRARGGGGSPIEPRPVGERVDGSPARKAETGLGEARGGLPGEGAPVARGVAEAVAFVAAAAAIDGAEAREARAQAKNKDVNVADEKAAHDQGSAGGSAQKAKDAQTTVEARTDLRQVSFDALLREKPKDAPDQAEAAGDGGGAAPAASPGQARVGEAPATGTKAGPERGPAEALGQNKDSAAARIAEAAPDAVEKAAKATAAASTPTKAKAADIAVEARTDGGRTATEAPQEKTPEAPAAADPKPNAERAHMGDAFEQAQAKKAVASVAEIGRAGAAGPAEVLDLLAADATTGPSNSFMDGRIEVVRATVGTGSTGQAHALPDAAAPALKAALAADTVAVPLLKAALPDATAAPALKAALLAAHVKAGGEHHSVGAPHQGKDAAAATEAVKGETVLAAQPATAKNGAPVEARPGADAASQPPAEKPGGPQDDTGKAATGSGAAQTGDHTSATGTPPADGKAADPGRAQTGAPDQAKPKDSPAAEAKADGGHDPAGTATTAEPKQAGNANAAQPDAAGAGKAKDAPPAADAKHDPAPTADDKQGAQHDAAVADAAGAGKAKDAQPAAKNDAPPGIENKPSGQPDSTAGSGGPGKANGADTQAAHAAEHAAPADPAQPSVAEPAAPNNAGGASPTHQGATTAGNGALAGLEADPHAVHAPDLWPVAQSEPGDTYVVPQEPVPPPSTPTAADPVAADHPPANGGALGEIAATPPGAAVPAAVPADVPAPSEVAVAGQAGTDTAQPQPAVTPSGPATPPETVPPAPQGGATATAQGQTGPGDAAPPAAAPQTAETVASTEQGAAPVADAAVQPQQPAAPEQEAVLDLQHLLPALLAPLDGDAVLLPGGFPVLLDEVVPAIVVQPLAPGDQILM